VRRISIDGSWQLAFRVSSLFVYKVIIFHEGKRRQIATWIARIVELDEREGIGVGGSLVNSQLKDSKFGREGEME